MVLDGDGNEVAAGAAGLSQPDDPASSIFTVDTPLRIASNTKTYVAATILRLWESGRIDLDAVLTRYIDPALERHLQSGSYLPSQITIRQVLAHSAGFFDHAATDDFLAKVLTEPTREWTREEQIQFAIDVGDPVGTPGAQFHYSDTGYLILGHIIERIVGRPLAAAVREELHFDELGLSRTWWELHESPRVGLPARAHQYISGVDTHDFHPSLDLYGGGGLVTSVRELAMFNAAMFGGEVFERARTLDEMMDGSGSADLTQYRLGLQISHLAGYEALGHNGFWGTVVYHVPEIGLTIAGAVTEQEGFRALLQLISDLTSKVSGECAGSPTSLSQSPPGTSLTSSCSGP